jgi:hypothetical protein
LRVTALGRYRPICLSFFSSAWALSRASLELVFSIFPRTPEYRRAVAVAEFLLNGLHLLIQVVLALVFSMPLDAERIFFSTCRTEISLSIKV